jgi:AraC-like DNA-binding protein
MPGAGDPEIASQFVPAALRRLRAAGIDPAPFIQRHGLPETAADDVGVQVPISVVRAVSDEIAAAIPDPFLGISVVRFMNRGSWGVLEYMFRTASTCRDVLREFVRYSLLVNTVMDITFNEDADGGVFNHVIRCDSPEMAGRHASEYACGIVVGMGRELTGKDLAPKRAWFCHERPADTSELEAFFRCPMEFRAGANGLLISKDVLELKVQSADPVLHAILETQAQQEVKARAPSADFLGQVQAQILEALPGGAPSVEQVAARLKMSARTLQRRLAEQGKTFERVVDDARRDAALLLMSDERKALAEISFEVGYSDVRAFTRAFKRWTGKSPGEFRRGGSDAL